jgi:hypothetical protein
MFVRSAVKIVKLNARLIVAASEFKPLADPKVQWTVIVDKAIDLPICGIEGTKRPGYEN